MFCARGVLERDAIALRPTRRNGENRAGHSPRKAPRFDRSPYEIDCEWKSNHLSFAGISLGGLNLDSLDSSIAMIFWWRYEELGNWGEDEERTFFEI